jgi:hypothetical protein
MSSFSRIRENRSHEIAIIEEGRPKNIPLSLGMMLIEV